MKGPFVKCREFMNILLLRVCIMGLILFKRLALCRTSKELIQMRRECGNAEPCFSIRSKFFKTIHEKPLPTWAERRFTGMWSLCNVSKDRKAFILHPSHSRETLNSLKWKWRVFSVTPGDQLDQITSCFKNLCRSASTVLLNPSCARIQLHVSKSTWN